MKKIILVALMLLMSIPAFAQDMGTRPLKVIVTDKQGRNIKKLQAYGFIEGQSSIIRLSGGRYLNFAAITDRDTLNLVLDDTIYTFPLEGVDSLSVMMKNRRRPVEYAENGQTITSGFLTVPKKANTYPVNSVDVSTIENYRDLADYIDGRVPGVMVIRSGSTVALQIRGVSSLQAGTDPLIIVDGSTYQDFNMVNNFVNPRDIKSITVDKNGGAYGIRGTNGVVIITTKSGGE